MNGLMDENQLTNFEKYEIIKPLFHKIDEDLIIIIEIVTINVIIHLNMNVNMILDLQIIGSMKLLF